MTRIVGCQIEPLDHLACKAWIDFVLALGAAPADLGDRAWLLCHSDDGVTWGRREAGQRHLASTSFPDLCPVPSEPGIQEMRVFSSAAEILIWRTVDGLRGRVLSDHELACEAAELEPHDEDRLLLSGSVGEHTDGFTPVGDGTGTQQVLPVRVTEGPSSPWPRLRVRHYFVRDDHTGCVRVAATRLMAVR